MVISFTYDMCRWVSPPSHMLGHCCSVATDFGCLRVEKPTELGHRRRRVDRWPAFGVNDCTVASVGTGTGDLAPANKGTTAVGGGKTNEAVALRSFQSIHDRDRQRVGSGTSVQVRVDLDGRRI